jgi:RNA polymerase sigma-70 factor, ECF subfamily
VLEILELAPPVDAIAARGQLDVGRHFPPRLGHEADHVPVVWLNDYDAKPSFTPEPTATASARSTISTGNQVVNSYAVAVGSRLNESLHLVERMAIFRARCKNPAAGATMMMENGTERSVEEAMIDWKALIDEHGPWVVRISWRILGHASDVEDNVQEVFLEAFRLHAKEPIRHWRGLLRRLATLGALAKLRRRRKEVSLEDAMPLDRSEPQEDASRHELEERLRAAIAALPDREGAAFSLRYFEGLELPEIAKTLGISYAAAATAISRAKAKLQQRFAEVEVENEP